MQSKFRIKSIIGIAVCSLLLLVSCKNEPVDDGVKPVFQPVNTVCNLPYDLKLTPIVNGSATLSWTPGQDEIQWEVCFGLMGFDVSTAASIICNTNSLVVNNLDPTQNYQFYIKSHCTASQYSGWCYPYTYQAPNASCAPVTALNVRRDSMNGTIAFLNWNNGGTETSWEIQYAPAWFRLGTGTVVPATSNPFSLTGFDPTKEYDFFVRSNCAADGNGIWTGPFRLPVFSAPATSDYWPTALNNFWTYNQTGLAQSTGQKKIATMISGSQPSYQFEPEDDGLAIGPLTKTLRKGNGDYFIKIADITYQLQGMDFTLTSFEYTILKDYAAVNETWTTSATQNLTSNNPLFPATTVNVTVDGTMVEKGISMTINGTTFTDVIHVKLVINQSSTLLNNSYEDHYWFAKDRGPIKITSSGSGSSYTKEISTFNLY
jgi:archaellum component FlaG (FlaF/FlaG flagellin family)